MSTPEAPFVLFDKIFSGFEAAVDIERDISEMFDERLNPPAAKLKPEFDGDLHIIVTYIPRS